MITTYSLNAMLRRQFESFDVYVVVTKETDLNYLRHKITV